MTTSLMTRARELAALVVGRIGQEFDNEPEAHISQNEARDIARVLGELCVLVDAEQKCREAALDCTERYLKENDRLRAIWERLREWMKEHRKGYKLGVKTESDKDADIRYRAFTDAINKMAAIEREDSEEEELYIKIGDEVSINGESFTVKAVKDNKGET